MSRLRGQRATCTHPTTPAPGHRRSRDQGLGPGHELLTLVVGSDLDIIATDVDIELQPAMPPGLLDRYRQSSGRGGGDSRMPAAARRAGLRHPGHGRGCKMVAPPFTAPPTPQLTGAIVGGDPTADTSPRLAQPAHPLRDQTCRGLFTVMHPSDTQITSSATQTEANHPAERPQYL